MPVCFCGLVMVLGGGELEWAAEEIFGEVGEVVAGGQARGEPLAEVARTQAELRLRTRKAAALGIFIAMLAAGSRFEEGGKVCITI